MTESVIQFVSYVAGALITAFVGWRVVILQRDEERQVLEKRKLRLEIEVMKKQYGLDEQDAPMPAATPKSTSSWPWAFIAGCIPSAITILTYLILILADVHIWEWNGPSVTEFGLRFTISLLLAWMLWIVLIKYISSRAALFVFIALVIQFMQNTIISAFSDLNGALWSVYYHSTQH